MQLLPLLKGVRYQFVLLLQVFLFALQKQGGEGLRQEETH